MELYVFVWNMYNRHMAQNSKSVDEVQWKAFLLCYTSSPDPIPEGYYYPPVLMSHFRDTLYIHKKCVYTSIFPFLTHIQYPVFYTFIFLLNWCIFNGKTLLHER